jgi:hypothetical protein
MRHFMVLAVLATTACAMPGGMRRKPGSNVVLPAKVGLVEGLIRDASCAAAAKRDSATQTTARGGADHPSVITAGACSGLRRPMSGQPAPAVPPR